MSTPTGSCCGARRTPGATSWPSPEDHRVAGVVAQAAAVDGLAALLEVRAQAGTVQLLRLTAAGVADVVGSLLGRPPVVLPVHGRSARWR